MLINSLSEVRLEVGVDVELKRQMDLLTSFLGNI